MFGDSMLSDRMKKLKPYVPGEQPRDRRYLKLNTNENAYPPSSRIETLLKDYDIEQLRRYPDPASQNLRRKIAERYGVRMENVFVGNGSDEVLSFAFYAFFDNAKGTLLFPEFTYSFYPVYCDFYGIECRKIPLSPDFRVDIDAFLAAQDSCGIIFPNPNAPTGVSLPRDRIAHLLDNYPADRGVIIDEAYIDFGGQSAVPLIQDYGNLLIVNTFSKSMSLAGIRLGFAIGDEGLIDALFRVKDSFNSYPVDVLAQLIGEIAISDEVYYRSVRERIVAAREYFVAGLQELGWKVLPSDANFLFAGKDGVPGEEIYQKLRQRGILVRHFDVEGIREFVRITIGTPEEMDRVLEEVKKTF
jgi:histidinol-phosphate aminotransferase